MIFPVLLYFFIDFKFSNQCGCNSPEKLFEARSIICKLANWSPDFSSSREPIEPCNWLDLKTRARRFKRPPSQDGNVSAILFLPRSRTSKSVQWVLLEADLQSYCHANLLSGQNMHLKYWRVTSLWIDSPPNLLFSKLHFPSGMMVLLAHRITGSSEWTTHQSCRAPTS